MFKHNILKFLVISTVIGTSVKVYGASLDNSKGNDGALSELQQTPQVTLQDLKDYIHPILYQKFLRSPGDSLVLQQAKTVVSEYLADSLVESVRNPPPQSQWQVQPQQQRPASKQAANTPRPSTITSAGATLIQAVGGATRNRTRPSQQHVFNQVDSIIQNVNGANITGIVDQALLIRAPAPVRQLVNGIMNIVLCNPFNRLWNRCAGGGSLIFGSR